MIMHYLKRFHIILSALIMSSFFSCSMAIEDMVKMSSGEMIKSMTKNTKNARVTVGIVKNGSMSFTVYGENGRKLPNKEYLYGLGSISKAITGHLFARAIHETSFTLANLDDSINLYLDLPQKNYYPTIRRLLTHTSGYEYQYADYMPPRSTPYENPFYGETREMVMHHVKTINLKDKDYPFEYSNFGLSVAGMVLEKIFDKDLSSLVNEYFNDLGLNSIRVGDGTGNLSYHYNWNNGNPYIAAGGIVSAVNDLMKFAQMQMDVLHPFAEYAHRVWADNLDTGYDFPELDLHSNTMGLCWFINSGMNIIWHGGSIDTFETYIGFNKDNETAVVILSNIRSKIPAWVIGFQIFKELK